MHHYGRKSLRAGKWLCILLGTALIGAGGFMVCASAGKVTAVGSGTNFEVVLPWLWMATALLLLLGGLVLFLAGLLLPSNS